MSPQNKSGQGCMRLKTLSLAVLTDRHSLAVITLWTLNELLCFDFMRPYDLTGSSWCPEKYHSAPFFPRISANTCCHSGLSRLGHPCSAHISNRSYGQRALLLSLTGCGVLPAAESSYQSDSPTPQSLLAVFASTRTGLNVTKPKCSLCSLIFSERLIAIAYVDTHSDSLRHERANLVVMAVSLIHLKNKKYPCSIIPYPTLPYVKKSFCLYSLPSMRP